MNILIDNKCLMKPDIDKNIKKLGLMFRKIRDLNRIKKSLMRKETDRNIKNIGENSKNTSKEKEKEKESSKEKEGRKRYFT